ncbi:MAG: phage terminase large subunit family protein [Rhodobacteraceae bacterium]|nr:phage terminase large subunit family protein [Paracoccaceae bacterium]
MIAMPGGRPDLNYDFKPLAPYATGAGVLKLALASLAPSTRMGVVAAAEKYMKVNAGGRWVDFDKDVTPYAVEPASMISSRLYREIAFCGPARSGKTVMLMQGVNHSITCDPGIVHIFHMTEASARKWVDEELEPMIGNSPELSSRLGVGRSDDNKFSKRFLGGTKLTIGPPVIADFRARTIRLVLMTDIDSMALSIAGEGSPFVLGSKRTETLLSRGMTFGESSPGHPLTDPSWKRRTPHEAPPCAGILNLYNGGTKARWYWECFDCAKVFEPTFKKLHYNKNLSPALAGEGAEMQCPGCGTLLAHKHKNEANRNGYWLHEAEDGELVRLESGDVRKSERLSYWLNGAAASFSTWSKLVSRYETALRSVEAGGDEEPLKVTVNVDQGMPYLPKAMSEEGQLTLQTLKDKQADMKQAEAPCWTRFITVGVDVQQGKFVVQVLAWGISGERAVIDRFDLGTPPKTAPRAEKRVLAPETYIEDWEVLRPVLTTVYPLEGQGYGLMPLAIGCDFHGKPGVSDRAEQFWNARRKDGESQRWYMIRGHGGFKVPNRVWYKAPERAHNGKKVRSIKLLNVATDKLKDSVSAALSRMDHGPGFMHLGDWMVEDHLIEFTAERRETTGWKPRKGMKRNESIDLSVYGLAVAIFKGMERIDWDSPPEWAIGGASNTNAVLLTSEDIGHEPAPKSPVKSASRINFLE